MSWETVELGGLIDIKHGWAFKGEFFADSGELVLLTPGNAHETGGLKLKGNKEKYYRGEFPEEYLLSEGDLLVIMTDLIQSAPILGASIRIPESKRYLHNQRLGLIQIKDKTRLDERFAYHIFNTRDYRSQVRATATGATVRHTAPKRIYACQVRIPEEIEDQVVVSKILDAYDDLITTNQSRIELLEETARRIYREWFVHLRFPGYEQVPVEDGVPERWERLPLTLLVEFNPKTSFEKDKISPYVEMAALSNNSMAINYVGERIIKGGAKFKNYDTLLARITPCLENGKTGFVQFLSEDEVASGSTEFIVMRSRRVNPFWVYCLARDEEFREFSIRSMSGADGRQRVNVKAFSQLETLLPEENLLVAFGELVKPMFDLIKVLTDQNTQLKQARDNLLPKLMSGQLDINSLATTTNKEEE